ncbi:hypothetical protein LZ31DRAFT_636866, partial [Colletotrichum somersetense]
GNNRRFYKAVTAVAERVHLRVNSRRYSRHHSRYHSRRRRRRDYYHYTRHTHLYSRQSPHIYQ